MTTEDDEQSLSDVNKPSKSVMGEDKLGIEVMKSEGQCESSGGLVESNLNVGGEIAETVSLEDKPVSVVSGKDTVLEKSEATVEVIEQPADVAEAEEGSGEMSDGGNGDQPFENENEAEEDAKVVLETVVTDTDDALIELQLELTAEEESVPVVEAQVEAVVTEVGDATQFSPNTRGDELDVEKEATEEGNCKADKEMDDREKIEEVSGADNELIGSRARMNESEMLIKDGEAEMVVKSDESETVAKGDEGDMDKVDAEINNSDVGIAENSTAITGETVDPVITEEIPSTEVKSEVVVLTEFNADAVDNSEQENFIKSIEERRDASTYVSCDTAENKEVAAEVISETKMEGEELLNNPKVDEPVNVAEDREKVVAEEEHFAGDVNMDMDASMEEELADNIQLADAEPETETGDEVVAEKILEEVTKMETDEARSELDNNGREMDDSPDALLDEEDETMSAEEETRTQDTEMETETDVNESGKASGGKRKRGKLSKSPSSSKPTAKSSSRKTLGEDVCFICFDGGDLFLCDRRGCPKAYHPSCVNRDEAFFRAKGRWNCGWHMCSICEKTPRYMCYTCTFSLCRSCIKDAVIMCVRGNKGFCETCLRTVTLIENNEQENKEAQIDFDDKNSWEYLFKDYYLELKAKLSLTSVEIAEAKNPWKGGNSSGPRKQESSGATPDANDEGSDSDDSTEKSETTRPKRRKLRKQSKSLTKKEGLRRRDVAAGGRAVSLSDKSEWASKELLEFVSHMNDGDTSILSQFDVQALLLEYIKRNTLRDPRRKSQIICDTRLESLFGKPRVGHFEMLKLLESHFLSRDEHNDDVQGSVVDTDNNQLDNDDDADLLTKGRRRKTRRRSDSSVPQSNLDDYAAIDMHNISLIYLRRKLMEDLLEESENFHDKAVGTFVRIRISGSTQKQDLYRLVQVVGTSKAADPYKVGKKTTDIVVEILNLDKTEVIPIDTISNQEFTEEECKRLRQSIKCGLISRLTVGEILDKTMEIQVARINDWLESEVLRLSHLRDRASDLGRRKELRECVEKLQLLKTPEERRRRLEEIPRIHEDPKMDPSYESDENETDTEDTRRDAFMRSKGISRRGRGPISPGSGDGSVKDSWSKNWEPSRNQSSNNFSAGPTHANEMVNEDSWSFGDKVTQESNDLEKLNYTTNSDSAERMAYSVSRSESFSGAAVTSPHLSLPVVAVETAVKINESEKMWHYKDPSGKEQGPFSMVQLRKWNNTGYFPADLKIWRNTENQDNSVKLADALAGKIPKESPANSKISANADHHVSKLSSEKWARNEISSLPSPTPRPSNVAGEGGRAFQSPGIFTSPTAVLSNNIMAQSPAPSSVSSGAPYSPTPNTVSNSNVLQPSTVQAVQTILSQNLQPDTQGWTGTVQPQGGYGFSNATVPQQDFWRPTQGNQPNVQTPNNASWGVMPAAAENNTPSMGANPPNVGWGPVPANPNVGWVNPAPGNTNMNWGPTAMSVVPNANAGWVAPAGNAANMQVGPASNPGWAPAPQVWGAPPVQGPIPVNGWVPPGGNSGVPAPTVVQGPLPGNGWGPPGGNSGAPTTTLQGQPQGNANQQGWGSWDGEQNNTGGGGQFSGAQSGVHGRDSGLSGGRPWNRQSSFGGRGGGSGHFSKRDTVCPYNANGRCRKGANCDYLHV